MVDYQSRGRLSSYGYTSPEIRTAANTFHELYHKIGCEPFPGQRHHPVHNCRTDLMHDFTEVKDFEVWVLSSGLHNTHNDVINSHVKKDAKASPYKKHYRDHKLLYKRGAKGSEDGDFHYPRGLCTTVKGDIIVADSKNHRIQVFSASGVFKFAFGQHGTQDGELNEPSGVTELPNGNLAVADCKNRRVQVFSGKGQFCYSFSTHYQPYSIASDRHDNLAVASVTRIVAIHHATNCTRKFCFSVPVIKSSKQNDNSTLHIGLLDEQVVISDPQDLHVKIFTLEGKFLHQFRPAPFADGLSVAPGGLWVTSIGNILLVDTLNHGVSLYSVTGRVLKHVVKPTDGGGSFQSVAQGPEGHVILSECTVTGDHCLKIFRNERCPCHPGSRLPNKRSAHSK